jgi:hypothetical protein
VSYRKIDALKEIIRAWGLNPEEILTREALMKPHMTIIDQNQLENQRLSQLTTDAKRNPRKSTRKKYEFTPETK